jgi:hypothetical protein
MKLLQLLLDHSICYWSIAIVVSVFYGIQGILIQRHVVAEEKETRHWEVWEPWLIQYPEYFLHNLSCSLAGFISLYVLSDIAVKVSPIDKISGGTGTVIVFLSLVAILGISGKLSYVLIHSRFLGK